MSSTNRGRPWLPLSLVLLAMFGSTVTHATPASTDALAVRGATLVDGRTGRTRADVTILVEDGRVLRVGPASSTEIPSGAQVVEAAGKWVLPGLIDVHTHVSESDTGALRRFLAAGVTALHTMPRTLPRDPVAWEDASERPSVPQPRLLATPLFTGEFPDNVAPGRYELMKPDGPVSAREAVRAFHAEGYRQIKIIQDDGLPFVGEDGRVPRLAPEVFAALVEEARSLGMRIFVHTTQLEDTRRAVDAGVDVLLHGTLDRLLPADLWEEMRAAEIVWTPVFRVPVRHGDTRGFNRDVLADPELHRLLSERSMQVARQASRPETVPLLPHMAANLDSFLQVLAANTRAALEAGVPVAVGSDGGPAGVGTHIELEYMQEAGVTPAELLVAATSAGALAIGREDGIGAVEPGMVADLLVVVADPTEDIRNLRRIEKVIKGGRIWEPEELARD